MSDSVPNDSFDDLIADIEIPGTQDEPTAPSEPKRPRASTGIDEAGLSDDELANLTLPDALPGPSTTSNQQKQAASTADAAGNRINVSKTNCVLVNPKQRGNPILKSITNIPWEFDNTIVPDYVVGVTACILYLSLRYHRLNPDYIHARLKELGKRYELRILLVQVDVAVNAFDSGCLSSIQFQFLCEGPEQHAENSDADVPAGQFDADAGLERGRGGKNCGNL